ncbi:MAG: VWA domain-containing protein [Gemmatimonadetes bacterium]|nr:VWA domain-containing protein [Gemmatimonadota bacterium]
MIWRFAEPWVLAFFLPAIAFMIWRYRRMAKQMPRIRFSSLDIVKRAKPPRRNWARHVPIALRLIAVFLIAIALARPQAGARGVNVDSEGVDILIALDVSGSMRAIDLKPNNRLEAAKLVASDFIAGRETDRLGLVVFAGVSFVQCPLTLDYAVLQNLLQEIQIGMVEDGTAIGMAIVNCVNRLKESDAKSKVAILLTDGVNNTGRIDPETAAQVAEAVGVRFYTIGVGSEGEALYPVDDPVFGRRYVKQRTEIDEAILQRIAADTGGKYFRATDTEALRNIFQEIGELEKTKVISDEFVHYSDLFGFFLLPAACLLLLEITAGSFWLRRFP